MLTSTQLTPAAYYQIYGICGENQITCNWNALCNQLLRQWNLLTQDELEAAHYNRRNIAKLIQYKYGIPSQLAENYISNFERTLPLLDHT